MTSPPTVPIVFASVIPVPPATRAGQARLLLRLLFRLCLLTVLLLGPVQSQHLRSGLLVRNLSHARPDAVLAVNEYAALLATAAPSARPIRDTVPGAVARPGAKGQETPRAMHGREGAGAAGAAVVAAGVSQYEDTDDEGRHTCIPIREPICQGLQYTHTKMPNPVGLTSQRESAKRMNDYRALINVGCSHYLKFFLCTVYFPMCTPALESSLQPCRTLCRYVKSKCEPIMKRFRFDWPVDLDCSTLPQQSNMCIHPENYDMDRDSKNLETVLMPELNRLLKHQQLGANVDEEDATGTKVNGGRGGESKESTSSEEGGKVELDMASCTVAQLRLPVEAGTGGRNWTCVTRCGADVLYRGWDKRFADVWLLIWTIVCLCSTGLTLFTFLTDRARFRYPERPIVYLAACYFFYSIGCLLRVGLGRQRTACRQRIEMLATAAVDAVPSSLAVAAAASQSSSLPLVGQPERPQMVWNGAAVTMAPSVHLAIVGGTTTGLGATATSNSFLVSAGQEGTWCTIVFLVLYFFGMASSLWWVMLTVTWFLSAARKWGYEGVEAVSSIFHLLAWALPALKTIFVLILHRIDADELTGLCYVGYQNRLSLLIFAIVPQMLYLAVGCVFLASGFCSLVSVRANLKQDAAVGLLHHSLHHHNAGQHFGQHQQHLPTAIMHHQQPSQHAQMHRQPYFAHQQANFSLATAPVNLTVPGPTKNGNIRRLEKLMAKIGVFSLLYVVPSACLLGNQLYAYTQMPVWQAAVHRLAARQGCLSATGTNWAESSKQHCLKGLQLPSVELGMLQVFMSLVVGITSGMWVWCNRKTTSAWARCLRFARTGAGAVGVIGAEPHTRDPNPTGRMGSNTGLSAACGGGGRALAQPDLSSAVSGVNQRALVSRIRESTISGMLLSDTTHDHGAGHGGGGGGHMSNGEFSLFDLLLVPRPECLSK